MDFTDLKERLDLAVELEKDLGPGKRSGRWIMFSCPFPGHAHGDANPSLTVTPDNGRFYCFTCGRSGDLITWLHEYRELSWQDIRELAGSDSLPPPRPRSVVERRSAPGDPPSQAWQERGLAFVVECEAALWTGAGEKARAWLHDKRGFTDDTIRRYRLGYNQAERFEKPDSWGLDGKEIRLPRGIVIPAIVDGLLWYVKIRQPIKTKDKYLQPRGGRPALFGADNLRGAELVLLTEGEFDAILADQELRDVLGVATLGSAQKHLDISTWGAYLLPARVILAAYDIDQAGKKGVAELAQCSARIQSARVPALQSKDKDLTDFHLAGGDLWEWLKYNLDQLKVLDLELN